MIPTRLALKINVALVTAMVGISLVFVVFIYPLEGRRTEDQIARVKVLLETIHRQKKNDFANAIFADRHLGIIMTLLEIDDIVEEIDNVCMYGVGGVVQYCSDSQQAVPDQLKPVMTGEMSQSFVEFTQANQHFAGFLGAIDIIGERAGYLAIYYNLTSIRQENFRLMVFFCGLFFLGLLAIILLLNFFLFKAIINPLHLLRDGMKNVTAGNLGKAVELDSRDEIGEMVRTFNTMSATLLQNRGELNKHRLHLEELVRERTDELQMAKDQAERAEEKLREQWELLRTVMETIPNPLFYKDREGRYVGCNPAFEVFIGKPKEDIIGLTVHDIAQPEFAERYEEKDRELLTDGGTQSYEWKVMLPDGELREVAFSKAALKDKYGKVVGMVGIMSDITDLVRAREQAEMASRAKSQFLANMSHEIRTPMNGVIGMTTLLIDTDLDRRQLDFVETIRTSGNSLLRVINDILDYSKIEAGKLELQKERVDLHELLDECLGILQLKAGEKGLHLISLPAPDIPVRVETDRGRLKQILLNLAGNAIKFTESGKVVIQVEKLKELGQDVIVRFAVRDTGIGISKDQQQQLFESFSQLDGSYTRKYGGTGLGLAISKELVELLGGAIGVTSRVGEGSEFSFTLRLRVLDAATKILDREHFGTHGIFGAAADCNSRVMPLERMGYRHFRILLAEDNHINMQVALGILEGLGYLDVTPATNGREAIELLQKRSYDLVLMDLSMPELDGFEATRAIRKGEGGARNQEVPVLALTAHAMLGDRERCLAAGMNGYLTKPLQAAELQREMLAQLQVDVDVSACQVDPAQSTVPMKAEEAESVLDYQELLNRLMGDGDLAQLILNEVEQELPKQLAELCESIEGDDLEQAVRQAHKMKGAALNVGAGSLFQVMKNMESLGGEKGLQELRKLLPEAVEEVEKLRLEIARL